MAQEEDPLLAEVRRLRASEGLQLPEEHRPAIEDLSVACFHTDHLGTPLRLTGEQGKTLWLDQVDDWGAIDHEQDETDQPIRFQEQYRDEESGLYYNRYRYYAPELGRYVTQDPIGLKGGSNAYMYVDAAPLLIVDPLGQDGISISGALQISFALYSHQFGIADILITGVESGAAITFPGPWSPSAEFDIGVFGGGNTEMEFGAGKY